MNQNNKTGHFTCYKNRTFSFATDILDLVPGSNFLGQLFFSDLFLKILKWASLLLGNIDGVLFDPLGMLKEKPFQFTESNLGAVEELRHLPATHDRQIATKQHPIEAGQHTMNPFLMLGNEFLHDLGPQDDLLYP